MNKLYLRKICILPVLLLTTGLMAQNVGINTTGASPNAAAILDLNTGNSGTMGFLPEQVALTANNSAAPIILPPAGLIIYNTATAGSSPNNVIPGYYYWDGAQWQLLLTGSGSTTLGWTILGNTGITASSSPINTAANNNFIGTTNAADFVMTANGFERMRIANATGNVGVSNIAPSTLMQIGNANTTNGKLSVYSQDSFFGQFQIGNPTSNGEASMQFISGVTAFGDAVTSTNGNANLWNIGAGSYGVGGSKFNIADFAFGPVMTWTSAGLVGVNTVNPQQNLSVNHGVNIDQANGNNGLLNNGLITGDGLSFGSNSGEGIADNRNSSSGYEQFGLQFYTGDVLAMNIANMSSGTQPGQVSVINGFNVDQAGVNNGFLDNNLTTGNGLTFGLNSGEGIASRRTAGSAREFGLDFYTDFKVRMTIINFGNVGIADTVPTTLLQVGGGAATGKLSVYSQDNFNGQFQIGNPANNSEASMNFISGVTAFGDAATSNNGNNYIWNMGAGNYGNGGNTFSIANVGLARPIITLTASGNVGINTTGPARELEIGGITNTIRIDGLTAAGTFYSANTAPTAASSIMFSNNATGDVQALTPSATNGQVLTQTATGPAWQSMGALNNVVVITSSVSYTPSIGTKSILVKLVGGGGGGGGVAATVSSSTEDALAAGGGGAGGYCEYYIANVAAFYLVTVGAGGSGGAAGNNPGNNGGSTTFNGVTAGGGSGGSGSAATVGIFFNTGGNGGTALAGTVNIPGNNGGNGVIYVNSANPAANPGVGGSGPLGQGGTAPYIINQSIAGNNGTGYGSGGSGAVSTWTSGGNNGAQSGGNGTQGVIIIYEYK